MDDKKIKVDIVATTGDYKREDGRLDLDDALKLCGKFAGICYDKEGLSHIEQESEEKTLRRVNMTLNNGHHSVYDHFKIIFNLQNIPKMLAMVLNNEHDYATSEKSLRYTPVVKDENGKISEEEETLYNKWCNLLSIKIKEKYGNIYSDNKIKKLAQENARYLVTVFAPTQMIYTTSLRQINYIASWMSEYIQNANMNDEFEGKLASSMHEFLYELQRSNVLCPGLTQNDKKRSLSIFGKDLKNQSDEFGRSYFTTYKASFAEYAQAQRHRTIDYQLERDENKEYYIPPIIRDDDTLTSLWLDDMEKVANVVPQGELVNVSETGKFNDFILKCKERLCSAAQLEIADQTRDTLLKYKKALEEVNHPLANDIEPYSHGARCTFPDYKCQNDCGFVEGKKLVRKI